MRLLLKPTLTLIPENWYGFSEQGGQAVQPKRRVTLYLDAAIVERFKQQAGDRGYQTLINETLKSSFNNVDIEATLRKVIREELQKKAA